MESTYRALEVLSIERDPRDCLVTRAGLVKTVFCGVVFIRVMSKMMMKLGEWT